MVPVQRLLSRQTAQNHMSRHLSSYLAHFSFPSAGPWGFKRFFEYLEIGTINEAFYEDRYGVETGASE